MLSFPPTVAPTKVLIVPLSSHGDFKPFVRKLSNKLQDIGVSSRVDDSGASIGKRYSRNDELGTPLGITIDVSCPHGQKIHCSVPSNEERESIRVLQTNVYSSNPLKITHSHCATAIQQNRCALASTTSALPFLALSPEGRSGRTCRRGYPSSRAKRWTRSPFSHACSCPWRCYSSSCSPSRSCWTDHKEDQKFERDKSWGHAGGVLY